MTKPDRPVIHRGPIPGSNSYECEWSGYGRGGTDMSGEVLRRAAALMRERATRPDRDCDWWARGSWYVEGVEMRAVGFGETGSDLLAYTFADYDAEHIAAWDPRTALAVAEWLEVTERDVGSSTLAYHAAVAVARAYLGGEMSACSHRWASIPGSNDYECEWCGSRKGDTGSIYPDCRP